jgi:hypothetical protein
MGATWVLGKKYVPILTPACDFKDLDNTAFKGIQARKIHNKNDLTEIFDELLAMGIIESPIINRFNNKLEGFLKSRPWGITGGLGDPLRSVNNLSRFSLL